MRSASVLIAIALAGCGGGGAEQDLPCHNFGCGYDLSSPDGTRLRNGAGKELTQDQFEAWIVAPYLEVEACAQVLAGGPLVIISNWPGQHNPPQGGNTFIDADPLILLDPGWVERGADRPSGLKHEYVHYLLAASGFPADLNRAHDSPLFMECAGI